MLMMFDIHYVVLQGQVPMLDYYTAIIQLLVLLEYIDLFCCMHFYKPVGAPATHFLYVKLVAENVN